MVCRQASMTMKINLLGARLTRTMERGLKPCWAGAMTKNGLLLIGLLALIMMRPTDTTIIPMIFAQRNNPRSLECLGGSCPRELGGC